MTNILTDAEIDDIRAYLARQDPTVGQGYTGWAIAGLLATVDSLRFLATDINPTNRYERQEGGNSPVAAAYAESLIEHPDGSLTPPGIEP